MTRAAFTRVFAMNRNRRSCKGTDTIRFRASNASTYVSTLARGSDTPSIDRSPFVPIDAAPRFASHYGDDLSSALRGVLCICSRDQKFDFPRRSVFYPVQIVLNERNIGTSEHRARAGRQPYSATTRHQRRESEAHEHGAFQIE